MNNYPSKKIATWNVNSIKVRAPQVIDWLKQNRPTILALQETKTVDENFPKAEMEALGYQVILSGQKTFNGMAILTQENAQDIVTNIPEFMDPQRRILAATIADLRIINLYVPNGADLTSEKYVYKLDWLEKVTLYLQEQLRQYQKVIVLGDFNIAPAEQDVHDPMLWENTVLFSESARQAFQRLLNLGFKDAFRLFTQPAQSYSWWDYRRGAFWRNQGLRIDHILVNEELALDCQSCTIDKSTRKLNQPSDHAPVILFLTSKL